MKQRKMYKPSKLDKVTVPAPYRHPIIDCLTSSNWKINFPMPIDEGVLTWLRVLDAFMNRVQGRGGYAKCLIYNIAGMSGMGFGPVPYGDYACIVDYSFSGSKSIVAKEVAWNEGESLKTSTFTTLLRDMVIGLMIYDHTVIQDTL